MTDDHIARIKELEARLARIRAIAAGREVTPNDVDLAVAAETLQQQLDRAAAHIAELEAAAGHRTRQPWPSCPECEARGESVEQIRHRPTCRDYREEVTRSIPAPPKTGSEDA